MLTGVTTFLIIILFFIVFFIYRRDILAKLLTSHAAVPSTELQDQLNKTADVIIKRLEAEIAHLEYLLEEAETKSAQLEKQITAAETLLGRIESEQHLLPAAKENDHNSTNPLQAESGKPPSKELQSEKRGVVVAMAEQGYSITEIAKATGMGKGEIMLLLHLHKK
ncbi:MAG: hypothetical protein N2491_00125 [Negativicutes bacterium]|nr:hypothetical protein [Negativicutes bacterium]